MELGSKIRQLRASRNLTQQQVVDGLFDRSYLSKIEKGIVIPPYETVLILAKRLHVTVDELVSNQDRTQTLNTGLALLDLAKETKQTAYVHQSWEKFNRIRSIEHMVESALLWAQLDSNDKDLLAAYVHTMMIHKINGKPFPRYWDLYVGLGNIYYSQGIYECAESTYNSILREELPLEVSHRVHTNLGSTLLALGRYSEALTEFLQPLQFDNLPVILRGRLHQGLGICYRYLNCWEEALQYTQSACNLFQLHDAQRYFSAKHNLGVLWLDKKDFGLAYPLLQQALQFYVKNNARLSIAQIYEEFSRGTIYEDKFHETVSWSDKGIVLIQGTETILAARFFLWKGIAYFSSNETELARNSIIAAISILGEQTLHTLERLDPNMDPTLKNKINSVIKSFF